MSLASVVVQKIGVTNNSWTRFNGFPLVSSARISNA